VNAPTWHLLFAQSLCAAATLSLSLGAPAQSVFALDDTPLASGLALDAPGNWYRGTFGMEVWELNSPRIPAGINLGAAPGSGVLGYNAMVAAGFVSEATYANEGTSPGPGYFELGQVLLPNVPGATVVVALAAWNTSAPSWGAMLADANQATRAGILAFVQPTVPFDPSLPLVPATLAMPQDLVLSAIPEPSGLALAGLGGALLLFLRGFQRDPARDSFPA